MSTTNQNDGTQLGEQPAANVAASTQGEQPAFDAHAAIANLDSATLIDMLEGGAVPSDRQPAIQQRQEAPAANTEQPDPASEQPQDGDQGDGTQEQPAGTKPKGRLSVRALPEDDQATLATAIDMVRKGESKGIAEAILKLTGRPATPEGETPVAAIPIQEGQDGIEQHQAEAQEEAPSQGVAEIRARIEALREQRRQGALDYLPPDVQIRITEEIEAASIELLRAEMAEKAAKQSAQSYQADFVSAVEAVESKYPDSTDDTSPFSRILDDKVAAAKARRDPSLADPNFIIAFADEVAEMLGQREAPKQFQQPPARASRPVGTSLAPGAATAKRMTLQDARALVATAPIEDVRAALFTE